MSENKTTKTVSFTVYEDNNCGKIVTHLTGQQALQLEAINRQEPELALLLKSDKPLQAAKMMTTAREKERRAEYAMLVEKDVHVENMQRLIKQEHEQRN